MRADTIFRIASMTKPFTAVGVMILMEAGEFAVGDPVEKYLPDFKNMWVVDGREGDKNGDTRRTLRRPSRAVILRDLLTHTSGMYGMPPETLDEAIAKRVHGDGGFCHHRIATEERSEEHTSELQ